MRYFVSVGDRELEVELGPAGILIDGEPVTADLVEMDGTDVHSLLLDSRSYRVLAERKGLDEWSFHLYGHHFQTRVVDERTRAIRDMAGAKEGVAGLRALRAPMPGMVVKLEVQEGDLVAAGQGLVIVEAMKMENELKSQGEGRIRRILVEPGQVVEKDQTLVEFEVPAPASEKGREE